MGIHRVALTLCLVACSKAADPTPPAPEPAPWPMRAAAYEAALDAHRQGGWLVVKTAEGFRDEGDSLTWSGEAMGVSCGQAARTLGALEHMQDTQGGYYVRVEPLPDRYVTAHDVVSRDGWTGVAYGLTRAWRRCPDLRGRLAASWQRAREAVGGGLTLHPNAHTAVVTPAFRYVVDAVSSFVGGATPHPSAVAKGAYELSVEATVRGIVGAKTACYPLHLVFSEVVALAAMGSPISGAAKRDLCDATASTGLVNWRWYCQDQSGVVVSWLEQYQPNRIVYAHQRCQWESEDFPATDTAASLDWLTLRDLHVNGE